MKQKDSDPAHLTSREMEVMSALWDAGKPLIASDIAKANAISLNTIHAVLKKLMEKELIEVAGIVYSGTVLSRSYRPAVSAADYRMKLLVGQYQDPQKRVPMPKIVATLLEHDENEAETIAELEALLEERKRQLSRED